VGPCRCALFYRRDSENSNENKGESETQHSGAMRNYYYDTLERPA
jgi:hypothetical protein